MKEAGVTEYWSVGRTGNGCSRGMVLARVGPWITELYLATMSSTCTAGKEIGHDIGRAGALERFNAPRSNAIPRSVSTKPLSSVG